MKMVSKIVALAVMLLVSVGSGFAADVKAPVKPPVVSAKTDTKADAKTSAAGVKDEAKGKLIDINTASDAELKAIPGVGDAFAAKIIAGRPYANKTQLKARKIIPGPLYEQIKERIIAKQPPVGEKTASKPTGAK
jgi:DNA uptake protein ComE-like DNA-binding protein